MDLLEQLVETTKFAKANPIWQEGLADDVFEPFFACMLADMANPSGFSCYDSFVKTTRESAKASLATGGAAADLQAFWDKETHQIMRQKIAERSLVDESLLSACLPLGVHTGFGLLERIAQNSGVSVSQVVQNFASNLPPKLPAWATLVLDADALGALTSPKQQMVAALDDTPKVRTLERVVVSKSKSQMPMALLGALVALVVAGGAYYVLKGQGVPAETVTQTPATPVPTLAVETLTPSSLSMTVGQAGDLYACHAELGSNELSDKLIDFLQKNFSSTLCVIDINESLGKELNGFDRLTSVVGLLKTSPFATLELRGDRVFVNTQSPEDTTRLVADVGALMADVQVLPMPSVDMSTKVKDGILQASLALGKLTSPVDGFALARAMSLQAIDTSQATLDLSHEPVFVAAAEHLKANPELRLIIVVHRDETNDGTTQSHTQALAETIKSNLVAKGVSDGQLTAIGVGSALPAADNVTEFGRLKNRRVEFLVYDEAVLQALYGAGQSPTQMPVPAVPEMTAPMPAVPTPVTPTDMPSAYAVVDGRIVEQSPPIAQGVSMPVTAYVSPPVGQANVSPVLPMPTPAPSMPVTSGIDEELLRPIGIEPVYGGSAVQRANR